jgi:hypothetical protein
MSKALIIKRADGGVTVFRNPPEDPADLQKLVEKVKNSKVHEDTPGYAFVSSDMVDATKLPPYDEYRNAWGHDLTHRMPIARELHKDRMRGAREPKLLALDLEFRRAGRNPAKEADIEARAQVLRDVTADPRIEAAQTVAELKAIWPDILN